MEESQHTNYTAFVSASLLKYLQLVVFLLFICIQYKVKVTGAILINGSVVQNCIKLLTMISNT
jgi:hypothetical protein